MKKFLPYLIPALLVLALIAYITLTPMGALRFEILRHGYPISALTCQPMDEPNRMILDDDQIGYSLENPPFERDTQAYLVNWAVTRHGVFYTAEYYGWG